MKIADCDQLAGVQAIRARPSSRNGIVTRITSRNLPRPGRYRILSSSTPNTGSLSTFQTLKAKYTQPTYRVSRPTMSV